MLALTGERVLVGDEVVPATVHVGGDGTIRDVAVGVADGAMHVGDDLVLPGMVDLHGDAFERSVSPRPGVLLNVEGALVENDRQPLAAGITTALLAVTDSWEPGLRSRAMLRAVVEAVPRLALGADTKVHVRHEQTMALGHDELVDWLRSGRVSLLSLNDHAFEPGRAAAERFAGSVGRLATHDSGELVARCGAGGRAVRQSACMRCPAGLARRRRRGARSPRRRARRVDRRVPVLATTCPSSRRRSCRQGGDCARSRQAWRMVSAAPADAVGLADRGRIEAGARADLLVVDDRTGHAVVRAVLRDGRVVADFRGIRDGGNRWPSLKAPCSTT